MKKPKSMVVKRCGACSCIAKPPPPDPQQEKLSQRQSDAHKALLDATLETMELVQREASPRLKEALKREALARFDWQQAHIGCLTYKPVEESKKGVAMASRYGLYKMRRKK